MAVNKPIGDNARKGAVRKRSQRKTKIMGKKVSTKTAARSRDAVIRPLTPISRLMLRRVRTPAAGFIEPCLPSPAARRPTGHGWIHEIKNDGYRLMARRDTAGIRLITRKGCTEQVFPITAAITTLRCAHA
jgi:ATP-dependent DNA ligase